MAKPEASTICEYIQALSGVCGRRRGVAEQLRYRDAVNSLALVAPDFVLRALYAFQDEIRYNNAERSEARHDQRLTELFQAIRRNIHPSRPPDKNLNFRLLDIPPESWIEGDLAVMR